MKKVASLAVFLVIIFTLVGCDLSPVAEALDKTSTALDTVEKSLYPMAAECGYMRVPTPLPRPEMKHDPGFRTFISERPIEYNRHRDVGLGASDNPELLGDF